MRLRHLSTVHADGWDAAWHADDGALVSQHSVFGIALFRARVLPRWAAALLAVGGVVTAALTVMPDAFYRLLAFPNSVALIGLGYSLWVTAGPSTHPTTVDTRLLTVTGAE